MNRAGISKLFSRAAKRLDAFQRSLPSPPSRNDKRVLSDKEDRKETNERTNTSETLDESPLALCLTESTVSTSFFHQTPPTLRSPFRRGYMLRLTFGG